MSTLWGVFLVALGLVCVLQPEWYVRIERELSVLGTGRSADEAELTGWRRDASLVVGYFAILLGVLTLLGIV